MERSRYWLDQEPEDESYKALVNLGLRCGAGIIVVVRPNLGLSDHAKAVLDQLRQWLVSSQNRTQWPGTKLTEGGTALVNEYALTWESADVLADAADRLYAWVQPSLPEDLSIVRSDGEAWLVTIAHERQAFLLMTPDEYEMLREFSPSLAQILDQE